MVSTTIATEIPTRQIPIWMPVPTTYSTPMPMVMVLESMMVVLSPVLCSPDLLIIPQTAMIPMQIAFQVPTNTVTASIMTVTV